MASNASAPCLLDLPVELLHFIFRYILHVSDTFGDPMPRKNLIALCQTSSKTYNLAKPFLYEHMSFKKITIWKKFLRVITSNPDRALWVKKLRIVSYETHYRRWKGLVPSGLHLCAGVRELTLEGSSIPPMVDKLPRNWDLFPCLQVCKIYCRDGPHRLTSDHTETSWSTESLHYIWTSRNLRYLHLQGLTFIDGGKEPIDFQKELKPVKLLVILDCKLEMDEPAKFFRYRSAKELILRTTEIGDELEPFLHNFTDFLVDLEYNPHQRTLHYEEIPAEIKWPDLRSCENLKILKIDAFSIFEMIRSGPRLNVPSRVKARLPNSLQQLHLLVTTRIIKRSPFYEALRIMLGSASFGIKSLNLHLVVDHPDHRWRRPRRDEGEERIIWNPEDYVHTTDNIWFSEMCENEGITYEVKAEETREVEGQRFLRNLEGNF